MSFLRNCFSALFKLNGLKIMTLCLSIQLTAWRVTVCETCLLSPVNKFCTHTHTHKQMVWATEVPAKTLTHGPSHKSLCLYNFTSRKGRHPDATVWQMHTYACVWAESLRVSHKKKKQIHALAHLIFLQHIHTQQSPLTYVKSVRADVMFRKAAWCLTQYEISFVPQLLFRHLKPKTIYWAQKSFFYH